MAYLNAEQLKEAFLAELAMKQLGDLPDGADEYIPRALQYGYNAVVSALLARGYSIAQIDAWPRREEFNRHISLYWCFTSAAGLEASDIWVNKYNRVAELETVAVYGPDGVIVTPGGSIPVGTVGYGQLRTDTDRFTRETKW